jgi:hypothetical protein
MHRKILLLLSCVLLFGCAGDDVQGNGITRARAISIAKSHCPEYPDRFSFVDRAQWIPEKSCWVVLLADRSGNHGRLYKINSKGEIIGWEIIGSRDTNENDDYDGGPRGPGWWW